MSVLRPRSVVPGIILVSLLCVPHVTAQGPAARGLAGQSSLGTEDFFETSDGVTLRYLAKGSGRPIVFVPGWTMAGEIWEPQLREFSTRYRTIALDPGRRANRR